MAPVPNLSAKSREHVSRLFVHYVLNGLEASDPPPTAQELAAYPVSILWTDEDTLIVVEARNGEDCVRVNSVNAAAFRDDYRADPTDQAVIDLLAEHWNEVVVTAQVARLLLPPLLDLVGPEAIGALAPKPDRPATLVVSG